MPSAPSPYIVIRRLGSGGMAEVFLAKDTSRGGRLVALKRIRGSSPELLVHFTREARVGALLTHPNVVGVEGVGVDEGGPFLALEFVDGVSASGLLRYFAHRRTALPLELWCVLARDMAAGLQYAHTAQMKGGARGVLHRDLSLDNVLVSRQGVARLSDFGLAYTPGDTHVTRTGTVKGKVAYLAPELFEGGAYSTASDVYALGVVLFRLATGMLPFRGSNEGELILNILHGERPVLSALRPDLPSPLAAWGQQAIGKRPEARPRLETLLELLRDYEVAGEVRAALAQAVVAASEHASSALHEPWAGEGQTQRVQSAPSEPRGGSADSLERLPPAELLPAAADEGTERIMRVLPTSQEAAAEDTHRLPSAWAGPPRMNDEITERRPPAWIEPFKAGEESTQRLPMARPGPRMAGSETPEGRRPGRSGRPLVWLLVGAVALGLMGALALSTW